MTGVEELVRKLHDLADEKTTTRAMYAALGSGAKVVREEIER